MFFCVTVMDDLLDLVASRKPPLKTDHHQTVYFAVPDIVTISLNTSLEPRRPLEKNVYQSPRFEGTQNALARR
jgi:hypothetical protein